LKKGKTERRKLGFVGVKKRSEGKGGVTEGDRREVCQGKRTVELQVLYYRPYRGKAGEKHSL